MPRVSNKHKNSKNSKNRVNFSCYLSEANNDLLRDYRFTQIMETQNTELTLSDVADDVFKSFREYISDYTRVMKSNSAISANGKYRMAIYITKEDKELLQEFRLKKLLQTGDINMSLNRVFAEVLDIFRAILKKKKYELMNRPEIVRVVEPRGVTKIEGAEK